MRLTGPSAAVLTASNLLDASPSSHCSSRQLSDLDVFGAKILAVDASPLQNYTAATDAGTWSGLDICNVTVTYTHPGRNDTVHVDVWLPLGDWNGRFQGAGGGGWRMGPSIDKLASAVSQGFSVARTDGGHDLNTRSDPEWWALDSPGNVDLSLLQNFASLALNDLANIGKQITANFYGTPAKKSYWNGCSTGGRQGIMLAQRYPDAFDGVLAIAPAINWAHFLVAMYWPQQVMNQLGYYPPPCVLEAINQFAIEACDTLDGVADGIISDPRVCDFDATTAVGKSVSCNGTQVSISKEVAIIANATWSGARDPSGRYNWYGLAKGTPFYNASATDGLVGTDCTDSSASSCSGAPSSYSRDWIKYFIYKDPNFSVENMTDAEFFATMHKSVQEYESVISASDPDLSSFKKRGGKMITWHGLSDQLIFPGGTVEYYEKVRKLDPAVKDFYRFFEAPGVEHCSGGIGPLPSGALSDLIRWVEEEEVPETLLAVDQNGAEMRRRLCLWPKKQEYVGGDPDQEESFTCV
ncbi:uncharacterized protein MYCFIDRAFT_42031 [Pseudocercospora fijiensis CIRAD86]|uniref:Carboxylic ester hydrolase n=1 Tax=Pseudocercospora fijiensis (strain CIRAD86) TaxID=383855 RepID=M3A0P8_PSEFD|nr:uncharacterized protein MYCFIDRAFT_42031 [Pseudocercospora fijiensis CIRAD86]EME84719.1 hypothetical protein MYCFIDRAFT_42031 [Pseudocercospora fijiensis CIRAD86]